MEINRRSNGIVAFVQRSATAALKRLSASEWWNDNDQIMYHNIKLSMYVIM